MFEPPNPDWLPVHPDRLPSRDQVPSPGRRELAALLVVLLAVSGVWVRLADPAALRGEPPAVDADDPPGEVAADAVERLQYVDYTYTEAASPEVAIVTRVDNTDEAVYSKFGERRWTYATEGAAWVRRIGTGWLPSDEGLYSRETAAPFDHGPLRSAEVTVLEEGDGRLVVAVDDPAAVSAAVGQRSGADRLVLHVDTDRGRLERAVLHRTAGDRESELVYRFYNYGETDVRRPDGVPGLTFEEAVRDVLRG